jgi:hypothetical protein
VGWLFYRYGDEPASRRTQLPSASRVGGWRAEIIDDHFRRANDFVALAIAAPENFQHHVVRLRGVGPGANGFVTMRVERLANTVLRRDAVPVQELLVAGSATSELIASESGRPSPDRVGFKNSPFTGGRLKISTELLT